MLQNITYQSKAIVVCTLCGDQRDGGKIQA